MDMVKTIQNIDVENKPRPLYDVCLGVVDAIKESEGAIPDNVYNTLVGKSNEFYLTDLNTKKKEFIEVIAKTMSEYDKKPYVFHHIEDYLLNITKLR